MQKPNPVIKNYILSPEPLFLNDKISYKYSIVTVKTQLQQDYADILPPKEEYNLLSQ